MRFLKLVETAAPNLAELDPAERRVAYDNLRERMRSFFETRNQGPNDAVRMSAMDELEETIQKVDATFSRQNETPVLPNLTPPTGDNQTRLAVQPLKDSQEPKGVGSMIQKVLAAIGVATILALLAASFAGAGLSNYMTAMSVATSLEQRTPEFNKNVALLTELKGLLEDQRKKTGSYPETVSAGMGPIGNIIDKITTNSQKYPSILPESGARLLYASNGKGYKLVMYYTGNCFVARLVNPEMVDTGRARGPMDCEYFGFWAPDAKEL